MVGDGGSSGGNHDIQRQTIPILCSQSQPSFNDTTEDNIAYDGITDARQCGRGGLGGQGITMGTVSTESN